jgi:hypothetical protein
MLCLAHGEKPMIFDFIKTAKEVLINHPVDVVVCTSIVALGVTLATMKHREDQEQRRKVAEILNRRPLPERIVLSDEGPKFR